MLTVTESHAGNSNSEGVLPSLEQLKPEGVTHLSFKCNYVSGKSSKKRRKKKDLFLNILYKKIILLPNSMGRWSHCYVDVHLNEQDQLQTPYYYKYRGKLSRQNVITQACVLLNTDLNKIII